MWVITEANTGREVETFENYREAVTYRDLHNATYPENIGPYNMRWEER